MKVRFYNGCLLIGRRVLVKAYFEKRDAWVGVYWDKARNSGNLSVYVCLVPFFPIVISIFKPSQR